MRTLPAGWSDPSSPNQTAPKVYLHTLDNVWPPASVQDGEALPAGWTVVADWTIDCDLDAPLMPGQVNAGSAFTVASGSCTIPQPPGGMLAPWRIRNERTPKSGKCELVASYNGYAGSTAFVLGQFILDPIKGKVSEPFVSLSFVQDLVRLRKPHDLPTYVSTGFGSDTFTGTDLLRVGAANNGYAIDVEGEFDSVLTSSYFPGDTDELTALQTITGANLGALYLSMDGATIRVLDADALLGTGALDQTLVVLDSFEDLSWSQDPNAAVDRIELSYLPPSYDDGPLGPVPHYDAAAVWRFPKGASVAATSAATWDFDPGTYISPKNMHPVGDDEYQYVYGNTAKDGSGSSTDLQAEPVMSSSGAWSVTVHNPTGSRKYLVAPWIDPSIGAGSTDYAKNTRSWITGTLDGANPDSAKKVVWGAATEDASNVLTFDLGRLCQNAEDAQAILDRIVTRVTTPSYVIDDVRVVPDVRRELADLYRIELPEVGLSTRAMVTGIKLAGGPGGFEQTLTIAALGLTLNDFDTAWDAVSSTRTLNDFDAAWDAYFPGATIDDFDTRPLTAS